MKDHIKTFYSVKDWFGYDSVPERVTKLEVKNGSLSVAVEMTDSEVKETVAKLLENFDKTEVIDILTDILKEK